MDKNNEFPTAMKNINNELELSNRLLGGLIMAPIIVGSSYVRSPISPLVVSLIRFHTACTEVVIKLISFATMRVKYEIQYSVCIGCGNIKGNLSN